MDPAKLSARLRDLVRKERRPAPAQGDQPVREERGGTASTLEAVLGGAWIDDAGDACFVVEREFRGGRLHGSRPIASYAERAGEALRHLPVLCGASGLPAGGPMLFLDLETTGLSGGAGTQAFLVGCGAFDDGAFRTRQFFLTAYPAERAMLGAVARRLAEAGALVTFNGKTFDLPIVETRYLFHRMAPPHTGLPHLDLLHPARRLWQSRNEAEPGGEGSCALGVLETAILGVRREGDVPGFDIPPRYFHYIRSGDAGPLEAVFEHNRLDLLSLALLTIHVLQLIGNGPDAARDARECLALGRVYERAGILDRAEACYLRAAGLSGPRLAASGSLVQIEALRALAVRQRRDRRFDEAARRWEQVLEIGPCPPAIAREAREALAIHHEHRSRNLLAAQRFALQALGDVTRQRREEAVRYRLSRLERKIAAAGGRVGHPTLSLGVEKND